MQAQHLNVLVCIQKNLTAAGLTMAPPTHTHHRLQFEAVQCQRGWMVQGLAAPNCSGRAQGCSTGADAPIACTLMPQHQHQHKSRGCLAVAGPHTCWFARCRRQGPGPHPGSTLGSACLAPGAADGSTCMVTHTRRLISGCARVVLRVHLVHGDVSASFKVRLVCMTGGSFLCYIAYPSYQSYAGAAD